MTLYFTDDKSIDIRSFILLPSERSLILYDEGGFNSNGLQFNNRQRVVNIQRRS